MLPLKNAHALDPKQIPEPAHVVRGALSSFLGRFPFVFSKRDTAPSSSKNIPLSFTNF
jgi:hypothetical protein